jgi:hypothetical protein
MWEKCGVGGKGVAGKVGVEEDDRQMDGQVARERWKFKSQKEVANGKSDGERGGGERGGVERNSRRNYEMHHSQRTS